MRSMLQTSPLQLEHTAQSCLRVPMTQSEDVDDDDNRPLFEQTMRKHGTHGNDTSTKPNPTTNSRKKAKTTKATSAAKHDMVSATKKAADAPSKAINGSGNRSSKNTGPTAPTTSTWAANRLTAPEPPSQDNRMETDGETPPAPTSSIPSPASTVSSPSFGSSLSSSSQSTTQGPPSSAALSGHASQTPPAPSCQPSLPVFPPAASTTISPASARGMRPIRPNLSLSPTASSSSTNTTPPLARALLLPRPPTSNQAHNQTSLLAISSNHPTTSLVPIRRGRPRTRSASASPMSSSSSSSSSPPPPFFQMSSDQ
ncbi:hypothetical protein DM01DRAFT_1206776 [Hesseltinella vesiculosa]|uniref:Uncharacterized protein n=1 Tax=Hesseltinella vesiculosa TaxID=101127 RepID=A0A1X2GPW8_9FUNG|nr:hypothetical protein DM01DRAFT_1206776 [Hesseltinella vesiculosa]